MSDKLEYQPAEYTHEVMAVVKRLHEVLADVEYDVGVNALMTMIAIAGAQCEMEQQDFLITTVSQIKHLMDHATVSQHSIQ